MKHFHRIRPDGLLFLLPLAVVGIQHLGKLHGPPGIHGQQEFQRIHGGIHAPGGINARAYPEPHVGGVQEARVVDGVGRSDARYFRQGFEAVWRLCASLPRPWRTRILFSATRGTMSATVATATRSR